ncbi:MAG: TIGR04076 family protein [Sutterella seckii]
MRDKSVIREKTQTACLPKELAPDEFELYDLKVTVEGGSFVCRHHSDQGFRVEGEDLIFPEGRRFSLYALAAILPLLPAKERPSRFCGLDNARRPHCVPGSELRRALQNHAHGKAHLRHGDCTVVPLESDPETNFSTDGNSK